MWGWVRFSAGAGVVLLIPPAAVFLLSGVPQDLVGEFLAEYWWVVAFSPVSVLPHVVIVTVAEIRAERTADREGVSLIVDEAGVYLGRARPRRLAWADIVEVNLIVRHAPLVGGDEPGATSYYATFLGSGAKARENPMRWRPRKRCRDYESLVAIQAAIRRYAPSVPVSMIMNWPR